MKRLNVNAKEKMKILNFQDVIGNPSVVCEFDVYLDAGITFHRCKLICTKKGAKYVSLPNYCIKSDDGTKKFYPYISFSENKGKEFQTKVMQELEPFLKL